MVLTMIKNTHAGTKPLSIKEAGRVLALLAQNIVQLSKNTGIRQCYATRVGDAIADSRYSGLLHPANHRPIGQVWPYRNLRRSSYCDDQIFMAVQVAVILEIGDALDAGASAAEPVYADFSLRHAVMEAQIAAREIVQLLVDTHTDGVDPDAALYQLGWFRKWTFLFDEADD